MSMARASERESALVKRCTRFAADYLAHLRNHPLYLDVLARLEAIPGTISVPDVELAFFEVTKEDRPSPTNTATN